MSNNAFELLLEMERNSKAFALPMPSQHAMGEIWQGMGFTCGEQNFVVALDEIQEVIPLGNVTMLPSSASWFLGVTNLRGHVLPVTDLQEFILDKPLMKSPLSKILIL